MTGTHQADAVRVSVAPSAAPPRPIPVRTVPRAAIEDLVARLVATGAVPAPSPSEMP